jgi:DNA-binding LytR/AlgR family response regulator
VKTATAIRPSPGPPRFPESYQGLSEVASRIPNPGAAARLQRFECISKITCFSDDHRARHGVIWAGTDNIVSGGVRQMERLLVKIGNQIILIRTGEIDWIEAEGKYVRIHSNGQAYLYRQTLRGMERLLEGRSFMRINRFVIVNVDQIRELRMTTQAPMQVVLDSEKQWTIGRSYRRNLNRALKV